MVAALAVAGREVVGIASYRRDMLIRVDLTLDCANPEVLSEF